MKHLDDKQIELISFLQVFGIILVVLGHSFTSNNCILLNRLIYSFHMPLFMFISGYLFTNSIEKNSNDTSFLFDLVLFFKKRTIRILLPYWFISSLVFFPKVILSSFSLRPINFSFDSYFDMLVYPGHNVIVFFWFLPTLFILSSLVFLFWKFVARKFKIYGWIASLLLSFLLCIFNPLKEIMILNLGGVIHYIFYFLTGIFYFVYQERVKLVLSLIKPAILITLLAVHFSIVYIFMNDCSYQFIVTIVAILGIIESILIGYIYIDNKFFFLSHLNGSSYSIYLFSWFPQVFVQFFMLRYFEIHWIVSLIISTLLGVYIPYLIFKLLSIVKMRSNVGYLISLLFGN